MTINYLAVLAAAIASMIIGGVWYGALFKKTYVRAMGWENKTPAQKQAMQKGMAWSYLWQFIASLVTFYVLARFINATGYNFLLGGIVVAFLAWLGFVMPMKFGETLWGSSKTLFWLTAGSSFIIYIAAGAILGSWHYY